MARQSIRSILVTAIVTLALSAAIAPSATADNRGRDDDRRGGRDMPYGARGNGGERAADARARGGGQSEQRAERRSQAEPGAPPVRQGPPPTQYAPPRRDRDAPPPARSAPPPTHYAPPPARSAQPPMRYTRLPERHVAPSVRHAHYDTRWHHYRNYPPRGYVAPALPRNVVVVNHYHQRYWYGGGIWYAAYGPRYVVVAPPIGVFVPLLPYFYTTLWFGGTPYYYANDAYYLWRAPRRAYEVVTPPAAMQASRVLPPPEDIFVYPREGQSPEQGDFDRYECHRWASDQTGFDPTRPERGVPYEQAGAARAEYLRAMTACLEARGYSVR
jgi:hypothetical protein